MSNTRDPSPGGRRRVLTAALATVAGLLIEVPVMLLVARFVNRSKG